MGRKKILWLCSWYPSRVEPFNGDFVQRHALAASLYHNIQVIHVYADSSGKTKKREDTIRKLPGLTETIIEFPKQNSGLGRLFAHFQLIRIYSHLR